MQELHVNLLQFAVPFLSSRGGEHTKHSDLLALGRMPGKRRISYIASGSKTETLQTATHSR